MLGLIILSITLVILLSFQQSAGNWCLGAVFGGAAALTLDLLTFTPYPGTTKLLTGAGIGALLGILRPSLPRPQLPFEPIHRHDHVALTEDGLLWIRDESGYEALLSKEDVRDWRHTWVAKGCYKALNRIELRINCAYRPRFMVPFDRHWDLAWGARWNAKAAEEWNARLKAFVHG